MTSNAQHNHRGAYCMGGPGMGSAYCPACAEIDGEAAPTATVFVAGTYPCGNPEVSDITGCARCAKPWTDTQPHTTPYHGCGDPESHPSPCQGIFTLCLDCWGDLSPGERWPYYAALLGYQAAQYMIVCHELPPAYTAERVQKAVLSGL